jgi:hypothetical protein
MKRIRIMTLFLGAIMLLSVTAVAQHTPADFRIAAGVSLKSGVFHQSLEIGGTNNVNTWALVGDTYNDENDERQYYAGIKYLHQVPIGGVAYFVLGGEGKVHLDSDKQLVLEPLSGIQLNFGKNIGLLGSVSTQIRDGDRLFNPINLGAGVQLVFRL